MEGLRMSKHTPGPWHVSEEWDGTSIKAGHFHVTHTIQSCGFHPDEEDKAVTQANARLIAAAPDLLEMLVEAANFIQPYSVGQNLLERIDAAIAKAKGGQP
jgi:hypothetical protein